MILQLVRHGIAEDRALGKPDADRVLTPDGVIKTRQAALGLASCVKRPDVILASPKTRAAQTAAIIADAWETPVPCVACDLLADGTLPAVWSMVVERTEPCVMLVGHEPLFSELIEAMIDSQGGPGGGVRLKKAGCAVLDVDRHARHALLTALLPPRVLRALA